MVLGELLTQLTAHCAPEGNDVPPVPVVSIKIPYDNPEYECDVYIEYKGEKSSVGSFNLIDFEIEQEHCDVACPEIHQLLKDINFMW